MFVLNNILFKKIFLHHLITLVTFSGEKPAVSEKIYVNDDILIAGLSVCWEEKIFYLGFPSGSNNGKLFCTNLFIISLILLLFLEINLNF